MQDVFGNTYTCQVQGEKSFLLEQNGQKRKLKRPENTKPLKDA